MFNEMEMASHINNLMVRLVQDIKIHEEERAKHEWKYHAGLCCPAKKANIQNDIRKIRRELLALYKMFDY